MSQTGFTLLFYDRSSIDCLYDPNSRIGCWTLILLGRYNDFRRINQYILTDSSAKYHALEEKKSSD